MCENAPVRMFVSGHLFVKKHFWRAGAPAVLRQTCRFFGMYPVGQENTSSLGRILSHEARKHI